jgi:hypothetical protein
MLLRSVLKIETGALEAPWLEGPANSRAHTKLIPFRRDRRLAVEVIPERKRQMKIIC